MITRDKSIAFFCSRSCPGDVILKAQDWANARGPEDAPVISGFHTPVERDVLRILLRERRPIIYTLARALEGARMPVAVRAAEKEGHALIASPFAAATRQTTARTAEERNRHVLTRATCVLIAHASPGGKTEQLAIDAISRGLNVLTLQSSSNSNLLKLGAKVAPQ